MNRRKIAECANVTASESLGGQLANSEDVQWVKTFCYNN